MDWEARDGQTTMIPVAGHGQLLARMPITERQRALLGQAVRFAVSGGIATFVTAAFYLLFATWLGFHPIVANTVACGFGVTLGYALHSRWSFPAASAARRHDRTGPRFLLVCLVSYCSNSAWILILTDLLGAPAWAGAIPMMAFTPLLTFALNRWWTFADHTLAPSPGR